MAIDPQAIDWQPALARASRGARSRRPGSTTARFIWRPISPARSSSARSASSRACRAQLAAAWLLAWPLTQIGLLARPDLLHYGGLSGVLHAGVACVAAWLIGHERGPRRAIGALLLAALAIKVVSETPWGPALRHPAGWDIATAPFAHASGLVAGLSAAALVELIDAPAACRKGTPKESAPPSRREGSEAGREPSCRERAIPQGSRRTQPSLDAVAVVLLVLCCFLWGLNQVAAKAALPEIPALWQAALRSSGAAILVWLWARGRGIALFERDGTIAGGLVAGALFAAEFFCIFVGLQFTTASRMVVFIYIAPFVVALGMPLIARSERLGPLQSAGLVLAFAGVAWAFAEGFSRPAAGPLQWLGDGLGVLAGVLWGATTLAIRASTLSQASAEKTLLYQLGVSAALLLAAALVGATPLSLRLSPLAWSSLAFQIVVVSFASYLAWFWLIRHYPATRLASFTMLTPVFGLVLGAVLLAEPVTARLLFALATVAAGIVLVNRKT